MPSMDQHPSVAGTRGIYKGLHVGDSGTAKTGSVASLLDAGYKIRVIDFEDGLAPLAGYAKKKEKLANVSYHTLKDQFALAGSYIRIKKAPSFQRAMGLFNNWTVGDPGEWKEGDPTLGPIQSWGDDTILMIDTLGSCSRAAFNMVLAANGVIAPSGQRGGPEQSHYGTAQDSIERMLEWLTTPELVPCHVIVNAHWAWQENAQGVERPYPATIGKALNPKVGQKFNNMLGFTTKTEGKFINTQQDGTIPLKTSKPVKKKQYPVETGLADLFLELVGQHPG